MTRGTRVRGANYVWCPVALTSSTEYDLGHRPCPADRSLRLPGCFPS
ncbi:hypothetical protein ACIOZL_39345 [Streptomyces sp. NPDC087769]